MCSTRCFTINVFYTLPQVVAVEPWHSVWNIHRQNVGCQLSLWASRTGSHKMELKCVCVHIPSTHTADMHLNNSWDRRSVIGFRAMKLKVGRLVFCAWVQLGQWKCQRVNKLSSRQSSELNIHGNIYIAWSTQHMNKLTIKNFPVQ